MRIGSFSAVFAALLLVIALVMPVPSDPSAPLGGEPPIPGTAPRCFALVYDEAKLGDRLAASVRLEPDVLYTGDLPAPGTVVYSAVPASPYPSRLGSWRLAGPDSVDVMVHYHGPLLRIPVRGGAGRGIWMGPRTVFTLMVDEGFRLRATPTHCDGSTEVARGV